MKISYMREYLTVVNKASFTKAAEKEAITQPALSKHMQMLESALGAELLTRSPRGIRMTDNGVIAYEAFAEIVDRYDHLADALVANKASGHGSLRLGSVGTDIQSYYLPALEDFLKRFPSVDIDLVIEKPWTIAEELLANRVDIGFFMQGDFDDKGSLSYEPLGRYPLRIVVGESHPAAGKEVIVPDDVAQDAYTCLKSLEFMNRLLRTVGYRSRRTGYVDDPHAAGLMVSLRGGYTIIPDWMCKAIRGYPGIWIADLASPVFSQVFFAYKTDNRNPLVPLFLSSVREVVENEDGVGSTERGDA